jgi:hypothetical protein
VSEPARIDRAETSTGTSHYAALTWWGVNWYTIRPLLTSCLAGHDSERRQKVSQKHSQKIGPGSDFYPSQVSPAWDRLRSEAASFGARERPETVGARRVVRCQAPTLSPRWAAFSAALPKPGDAAAVA